MANPSPAAITAIQGKVTDWTQSNAALATAINASLVANPTPQPTIPKPLTIPELLGEVGAADAGKLAENPNLPTVLADITSQDRTSTGEWIGPLEADSELTTAEGAAIMGDLQATEPDPSWQAQLPWPLVNLGRLIDADDVAAARAAGGH